MMFSIDDRTVLAEPHPSPLDMRRISGDVRHMSVSSPAAAANAALDEAFHFPPDLLAQLIDTIPLLGRSKQSTILFFKGAGAAPEDYQDIEQDLRRDKASHNKFGIARTILTRLNERGDAALAIRREVIKRVVEFEDFSICWENDQQNARGQVAAIRQRVNVQDSFTRMANARKEEADARRQEHLTKVAATKQRKEALQHVKARLFALFAETNPQRRGKALEAVLNDLFKAYEILIREAFELKGADGEGIVEQIDGVVEIDGQIYIVEMKWWSQNLGVPEVSHALVRVFSRAGARGLVIANPGFTEPALKTVRDALSHRTMVLGTLQEIVAILDREDSLLDMLRAKIRSAVVDGNPLLDTTRL